MRVIRCSSLPTWPDCERRFAVTKFRYEVEAAGFKVTNRPPSIGAPVGSGAHAAVARSWEGLLLTGDAWAPLDEAEAVGIATLHERLEEDGVTWDDTTPNLSDGELAIRKIVRSYRQHARPDRQPELVEKEMRVIINDDWELVGHCDFAGRDGGAFYDRGTRVLDDLKTGVQIPSPGEQLGAYDLGLEATAEAPQKVSMTYCRRTRRTAEQPPPLVVPFDRGVIRRQARRAINEVVSSMDSFLESGDPFAFRANPQSKLCGAKYCPAFHTKFCLESWAKPE